jgi:putative transcriptional regulator
MSDEPIIARRRKNDGKLVRILPEGREEEFPALPPLPHLSEEEIDAAAHADADNPPLTPERQARMKRVPRVKVMRRALHLTQEEFATRFHIPLGTLRDWEQSKTEPDQAARAYLTVIAHDPEAVLRALEPRQESCSSSHGEASRS